MTTPSAIAYEIFGPVWNLTFLGAVRICLDHKGLGATAWRSYAQSRAGALETISQLLVDFGLESEESTLLISDAPWNSGSNQFSVVEVAAEVAMLSTLPAEEPGSAQVRLKHLLGTVDLIEIRASLDDAAIVQLSHLFNGIVELLYFRGNAHINAHIKREILLQRAAFVAGASIVSSRIYDFWRRMFFNFIDSNREHFKNWISDNIVNNL